MRRGSVATGAGTLLALSLLAGSTAWPAFREEAEPPAAPPRLVAFDSCAEALAGLRAAAGASVGPWGFGDGWRAGVAVGAVPQDATAEGAGPVRGAVPKSAPGSASAAAEHSATNNHEPDADEPDLVKTDGRRIVTVTRGVLRVTDPATRRVTGRLDISVADGGIRWGEDSLLLHGDRALVLTRPAPPDARPLPVPGPLRESAPQPERPAGAVDGPRLLLVDLAGPPTVIGAYLIDGSLVDARQTGTTARVVVRSLPQLPFPYLEEGTDAERTAANRAVIATAGLDAWLPRYAWTAGSERHAGRVGCDRLSRPATWSGTSMLTVLSFDLATDRLGDGNPVSVAADASTVYGTASSLYLVGDQGSRVGTARWGGPGRPGSPTTEIYQFDIAAAGPPRYVAAGSVPGWLLNQYALSEWQGHLRVATTSGDAWGSGPDSRSTVSVLHRRGGTLERVGQVTDLGLGERIYSVRFLGGTGYMVTFRQTDPLYTLDLTDPTDPRVTGELKITGYSAYLHPVPGDRLLGVGQEADTRGRRQGLQVSLFDVHDPARPTRLARYHVPGSSSTVEFDPHAFLHWPATGLVALPVDTGAVRLLRAAGTSISEIGTVTHPGTYRPISRSLMVGDTLWTISDAGLRAVDPATARSVAWLAAT